MTNLRAATFQLVLASLVTAAMVGGCGKRVGRGGAGVGEPCAVENDCVNGLTCASGVCALPPGAALCTPGTRVCDGPDVDQCDPTGQGMGFVQNCPNGCKNGACIDPACELGTRRCASDGVEQCTLDASGVQSWQLVQPCPAGCDPATNSCVALACNPLSVRCSPTSPATVETCAADGSGWTDQACGPGEVCTNGACASPSCTIGAQRCGPSGVEACTAVTNGPPAWQLVQECPLGCDSANFTCVQLACKPLDVRCSPTSPNTIQSCASDGSGWSDDAPCVAGTICSQGTCVAQSCAPGTNSCDGNNLVTCDAQGSGIASTSACPHGCQAGACIQGVCTPGQTQCQGGAVQTCLPDGSGYTQTEACGNNSCETVGSSAACGVPVCTPLSRRCGADGVSVQVCLADGSGWSAGDSCGVGATCSGGVCSAPPAGCIEGALQCMGASVQECEKGNWVTIGACFGGCTAGGVCSGGSCGAQIPVAVPLPACASTTCPPPADGVSSLLAIAGPLLDSSGATLPDGTLVTVAATGGATISAADADPTTPGVQVRSVSGYADFALVAPPASVVANGAAPVVVSAQVGQSLSCAGTATVNFAAAGSYAYAAQDFTSDTLRDFTNSTADWRTDIGVAESTTFAFGTGADGPLDVSTLGVNGKWDLLQTPRGSGLPPFAPSVQVTGLDAQAAQVQGSVAGFSPGDEVLLIELQGASLTSTASAGSWELLTVATVADGNLTFTSPILGTYASAAGQPLAGEKVAIQRIPQFTNVNVPAGSTLTASAWDGTQGGIVAFRANGTVTAAGSISADALGYRAGTSTAPNLNQPGESYGGQPAPATAASARNAGAGGGGYLLCDPAHQDQLNSWYGAGGSYGTAGFAGSSDGTPSAAVLAGRAACSSTQGLPYGSPTLARLFPGSGSGSQQFNSQGACTTSTCPGESRGPGYVATNPAVLDYSAAFAATGATQGTTFSFCSAETKSYTAAYETGGASACNTTLNPNCASTFSQCGTSASTFGGSNLTLAHASFNYAGDNVCNTTACSDTRAYCAADTKSYSNAWYANNASGCDTVSNPNCAQTYANCSAYNHNFASETCVAGTTCSSAYATTTAAGNCGAIPSEPNGFTTTLAAAAHPCNGNAACLATFATCGVTNAPTSNTAACVSTCGSKGIGTNYTNNCSSCGCGIWNQRDCYLDDGSCGAANYCTFLQYVGDGCEATCDLSFDCPHGDDYCDSTGCGFLSLGSPCYRPEYFCEDGTAVDGVCPANGNADCDSCSICNGAAGNTTCINSPNQAGCDSVCEASAGCTTNPGCSHNPGCSINPGCSTNVGCSTNTGCDTCGGRNSWDGNFCDFTNPSNACHCPLPWTDETQGGRGGGILFVAAQSLDLSGGGVVSARGGAPGVTGKAGFAGGSGGSLWVRVGALKLSSGGVNPNLVAAQFLVTTQFDASGAVNGGAGRVRIEEASGDSISGRASPAPYTPAFALQQVQSVSFLPAGKSAISAQLVPMPDAATTALIEGASSLVAPSISSNGGATFTQLAPGGPAVTFATTADLRFRVVFSPRLGPVARTAGLVWLLQLH